MERLWIVGVEWACEMEDLFLDGGASLKAAVGATALLKLVLFLLVVGG